MRLLSASSAKTSASSALICSRVRFKEHLPQRTLRNLQSHAEEACSKGKYDRRDTPTPRFGTSLQHTSASFGPNISFSQALCILRTFNESLSPFLYQPY